LVLNLEIHSATASLHLDTSAWIKDIVTNISPQSKPAIFKKWFIFELDDFF